MLPYYSIHFDDPGKGNDEAIIPVDGAPLEEGPKFECDICGHVEPTLHLINTHKFLKHGVKNPLNQYIHSTTCPVCFVCFHTRPRILQHIKYRSKKCRDAIINRGPILTPEQANKMDKKCCSDVSQLYKRGRRRNFAEIPCLKQLKPHTPAHIFSHNPNNTIHSDPITDEDTE